MKKLRSHNNIRTSNIDMFLFLQMGYELKLSYDEIKERYCKILEENTKDKKMIDKHINRLYRVNYTHFRNKLSDFDN